MDKEHIKIKHTIELLIQGTRSKYSFFALLPIDICNEIVSFVANQKIIKREEAFKISNYYASAISAEHYLTVFDKKALKKTNNTYSKKEIESNPPLKSQRNR